MYSSIWDAYRCEDYVGLKSVLLDWLERLAALNVPSHVATCSLAQLLEAIREGLDPYGIVATFQGAWDQLDQHDEDEVSAFHVGGLYGEEGAWGQLDQHDEDEVSAFHVDGLYDEEDGFI